MPRTWIPLAFVLYLITFAGFAFPWLRQAGSVIPGYPLRHDEELLVWILAWVAHALFDLDARVFDANIFHPAPAQLTGSEYLFSFQPLFAPLYLVTGQPLLATGLVTFITYPLGALAMAALLVRNGCSLLVAWLCGLTFALGILRVPLNFHTLQYPNLLLPLTALAAMRLRDTPGPYNCLLLFLSLSAALLTSFYAGAIVCITFAICALAELLYSRRRIIVFAIAVAISLIAAIIVARIVLHPYTMRSDDMMTIQLPWDHAGNLVGWTWLAVEYWRINGDLWRIPFVSLALLGLLGGAGGAWRRLAILGAALCVVSTVLVTVGLPEVLGQIAVHTPLKHLRGWVRIVLITDFGICVLAAAGLDLCWRRFGMRVACIPLAAFVLLTALPRLINLGTGFTPYPAAFGARADAYRSVKRQADEFGRGTILELPAGVTDRESMFGSTFHWLPLAGGLTGYSPPHARAIRAATDALPTSTGVQELVDLSHLRWILLRPDADWDSPKLAERMRRGLSGSRLTGRVLSFDGFTLYQVTASPRHPRWYSAIAAGPRPGHTVLGTPVAPLSPADAVGSIRAINEISRATTPGSLRLDLAIRNGGGADWPVLVGSEAGNLSSSALVLQPFTVYLEARWALPAESNRPGEFEGPPYELILNRDLPAGESVIQTFSVPTPARPGRYRLEVRLAQKDGLAFAEPPSEMLHQPIDVQSEQPSSYQDEFF